MEQKKSIGFWDKLKKYVKSLVGNVTKCYKYLEEKTCNQKNPVVKYTECYIKERIL